MVKSTLGTPVKLLHESIGFIVTIELKNGDTYRGKLVQCEDNMNCQLSQIILTKNDGQKLEIDNVYIRGSQITFVVVPDMLKNSPMFIKHEPGRGTGLQRPPAAQSVLRR
ncbi:hypothetical protein P9112_002984 [Eukaryota sp. TZLM1-RC]